MSHEGNQSTSQDPIERVSVEIAELRATVSYWGSILFVGTLSALLCGHEVQLAGASRSFSRC